MGQERQGGHGRFAHGRARAEEAHKVGKPGSEDKPQLLVATQPAGLMRRRRFPKLGIPCESGAGREATIKPAYPIRRRDGRHAHRNES